MSHTACSKQLNEHTSWFTKNIDRTVFFQNQKLPNMEYYNHQKEVHLSTFYANSRLWTWLNTHSHMQFALIRMFCRVNFLNTQKWIATHGAFFTSIFVNIPVTLPNESVYILWSITQFCYTQPSMNVACFYLIHRSHLSVTWLQWYGVLVPSLHPLVLVITSCQGCTYMLLHYLLIFNDNSS